MLSGPRCGSSSAGLGVLAPACERGYQAASLRQSLGVTGGGGGGGAEGGASVEGGALQGLPSACPVLQNGRYHGDRAICLKADELPIATNHNPAFIYLQQVTECKKLYNWLLWATALFSLLGVLLMGVP